jgi:GNAT superfamily N-acetyltransferase
MRTMSEFAPLRPGLLAPLKFSGLHRLKEGGCFAFARFSVRGTEIDVKLEGERGRPRSQDDASKLAADRIVVHAAIGSVFAAEVVFFRHGFSAGERPLDPAAWSSHMTTVAEPHRRRGVARSIYSTMQACGFTVRPSTAMLDPGRELWRAIDPSEPMLPERELATCVDESLMRECVKEFEPFIDADARLAACQSYQDIWSTGPAGRAYVVAWCALAPSVRGERNATAIFRNGRKLSKSDALELLRRSGAPLRHVWAYQLSGSRSKGAISMLFQAYKRSVQAEDEIDRIALAKYSNLDDVRSSWISEFGLSPAFSSIADRKIS